MSTVPETLKLTKGYRLIVQEEEKYVMGEDEKRMKGGWLAWAVFAVVVFFYLYEYLVRVAPSVMLVELEQAYGVGGDALSLSIATYSYIYGPMQLVVGLLFDRFGGKRLLVPATAVVAIGCYVVTMADSVWMMGIGRFLMGLGSAFGFVGVIYIATVWFPSNKIAMLTGLTTAFGMVGAIMGETVFAKIVEELGWKSSFLQSAWVGGILAVVILVLIPKPPRWEVSRREDFIKKHEGVSFFRSVLRILKIKQIWIVGLVSGACFLPLSLFADLFAVEYIKKISGVSTTVAGTAVSFMYLGWMVAAPVWGWYSEEVKSRKRPLMWGLMLSTMTLGLMLFFTSLPYWVLCGMFFLGGVLSSVQVITFVGAIECAPRALKGTAIALTNMIVTIVAGVLQPVVGRILRVMADSRVEEGFVGPLQYTSVDYRIALIVLPAAMLFGFILMVFMKEPYRSDSH